jgi:hypothetical protein
MNLGGRTYAPPDSSQASDISFSHCFPLDVTRNASDLSEA